MNVEVSLTEFDIPHTFSQGTGLSMTIQQNVCPAITRRTRASRLAAYLTALRWMIEAISVVSVGFGGVGCAQIHASSGGVGDAVGLRRPWYREHVRPMRHEAGAATG
jgi:hypothetical protein